MPASRIQRLILSFALSAIVCAIGYNTATRILLNGTVLSQIILKVAFFPISLASEFHFFGSISVMLLSGLFAYVFWVVFFYLATTFLRPNNPVA